jgi:hypothetical protein
MPNKPKRVFTYEATIESKKIELFYFTGQGDFEFVFNRLEGRLKVLPQFDLNDIPGIREDVESMFKRYIKCMTAILTFEGRKFQRCEVEIRVKRTQVN